MKRSFFQAAVTSILLYGCTTWTLTKRLENKLDGNYTRMLQAILNKSWRQHPTRHQLYGHLPPITKTIKVRWTRHAGHCWRSKDELISDVLLWTPTHGRAKAGWPARTYIQQLCEDTGCCTEDLPGAMNDREKWRERVRDIHATSTTWWWWWTFPLKIIFYLSAYVWLKFSLFISVKLATDLKAPFSIATTSRCKGEHYSFPWITPLTFDSYLIRLSIKQGGIKSHFWVFWYDLTWDWTLVSLAIGEHSIH